MALVKNPTTPKSELAASLGISRSYLYEIIDYLYPKTAPFLSHDYRPDGGW
jgi:DNA-binding IscR family transcriptional regulator